MSNGHISNGHHSRNSEPVSLAVMERLAEIADAPFDLGHARHALHLAEEEISGPMQEVWVARLSQATEHLSMRITEGWYTIDHALGMIRTDAPLLTLTENQTVLLLQERSGNQVLCIGLEGQTHRWITTRELTNLLGAPNTRKPIRWASASPMTPCTPPHTPGSGHGGLGGHGGHGGHDAHGGDSHGAHHHAALPPLRRLMGLLRPDRSDINLVIMFALGVGLFSLATPITVEAIVHNVQGGTRVLMQPVIVLSLVLFVFLTFAGLLRALQAYVVELIQQRIFVRVVGDLSYRLPRVRSEAFDRNHGPELVNRFFDVLTVQKASATILLDGVSVVINAAIGLTVLAFYDAYLFYFDIILVLAMIGIVFLIGRGAVRTAIQESLCKYAVAGWLEEMVRHPMAFKLSGGTELALERSDRLSREYLLARQAHFRILFRQVVFSLGLQALAAAALLGIGGGLVITGDLTLGQLVAAELIVVVVVGSFVKLGKSLESYYDLMAAVDKLGHLIDLPLEREGGEGPTGLTRAARLNLHRVSFAYVEGGHRPLLHHVDLAVEPGERVAIIGPHGSGKSTLTDLIYSLREPTEGRIELDGRDLREFRLDALRQEIAAVKGFEVFDGSILENIRVGRHHISLTQVRKALETVGLLDDALALPNGLSTRLFTGGAPLSAGQARRLMIARAIAGLPRLLVIDEALDDISADDLNVVLKGLFAPDAPWTLIVATHDPKIARRCDRRFLLAQGHGQEMPAGLDRGGEIDPDFSGPNYKE